MVTIFGPHKARNRQEVLFLALLSAGSAKTANFVSGTSLFLADHETGHVIENPPNLYRLNLVDPIFQKSCLFWINYLLHGT